MVTDSLIYLSMWHLRICVSPSSSHLCLMMDWIQTIQDVLQHAKLLLSGLIDASAQDPLSFSILYSKTINLHLKLFYWRHFTYKQMIAQRASPIIQAGVWLNTCVQHPCYIINSIRHPHWRYTFIYILSFADLYLIIKL